MNLDQIINRKLTDLKEELAFEESTAEWAWNAYGSELAGDIGSKANELKEQIAVLQSVLNGHIPTVALENLTKRMVEIDQQMFTLKNEKLQCEKKAYKLNKILQLVPELKTIK
jgi:hypothetical protein